MSASAKPASRSARTASVVTASSGKARMTWPTGLRMPVVLPMSSLVKRFAVISTPPRGDSPRQTLPHPQRPRSLSLAALQPGEELADEAAAEGDDADDEDRADDHRHPLADAVGEQVLQADDREGADHRAGEGAHAAEQRHQHDLARDRPVRIGERREAEDE